MHRIMLGMSICDVLASIWYFASTWAIPAGTLSWFGDGETETIFWAAGDQNGVACNVAGFFNQFAVNSPLYTSALVCYYLLSIYFEWNDRRLSRIEWLFHVIPVGYALITATFAAATDLYGHVEWTCWILPNELFDDTKDLTPIQSKFRWMQWTFLFGVIWVCALFVTVVFFLLYRQMKAVEKQLAKLNVGSRNLKTVQVTQHDQKKSIARCDSEQTCVANEDLEIIKEDEDEEAAVHNGEQEMPDNANMNMQRKREKVPWLDLPGRWRKRFPSRSSHKQDSLSNERSYHEKSRQIAIQGQLYVVAYYIVWLCPTINRITDLTLGKSYFLVQFFDTLLVPIQGFLNFCIYMRPRLSRYRKSNPGVGFWRSLATATFEVTE